MPTASKTIPVIVIEDAIKTTPTINKTNPSLDLLRFIMGFLFLKPKIVSKENKYETNNKQ